MMDEIAKAENAIKEILIDLELKTGRVVEFLSIREDILRSIALSDDRKLKSVEIKMAEKPGEWA